MSGDTHLEMKQLTLAPNPGRKLTLSKLKSLSKKYFSIPKVHLKYYPKYVPPDMDDKVKQGIKLIKKKKRKFKGRTSVKKIRKKIGRPKKLPVPLTGVKSITKYFRAV